MKTLIRFALIALLAFIAACFSHPNPIPPSSVGLYRDLPGPQNVKGSQLQVVDTCVVNYNPEETAEAITKSFNLMGLNFESMDNKKGLYTGKGNWNAPGQATTCVTTYTFAAYVEQIDKKPTSKLTVLIDQQNWCGLVYSPARVLMNQVMANFSKILMTF